MDVSIILPVYNDLRIGLCLRSLVAQDYPETCFEIIVVDNDSVPSIRETIRHFPVKYVHEARRGSYWARNRGLSIASGDVAAFTDADCIADPHWLSNLLRGFDDVKVGGVGGRILKLESTTWVQRAAEDLVNQQASPQYLPFFPGPWIVTANAAYRMSVLREVSGFDTQFQSGGDVDLAWRVWKLGYSIVTAPNAIVYHAARANVRQYFRQYLGYAVGHTLLFRKHGRQYIGGLFVHKYPFRQLGRTLSVLPRRSVQWLAGKGSLLELQAAYLDLVKYSAVICGDLWGAIKHRTPYI